MNKLFSVVLFFILINSVVHAESLLVPISKTDRQQIFNNNAKDIDLGPYIRNLQRTIKLNWNPPENSAQKRVVISFVIGKKGELLNYLIKESSGDNFLDEAAIIAIKKSAPFLPLPFNLKEDSIEIQFTFAYNILGASRTK